jgi:hypothetical protein
LSGNVSRHWLGATLLLCALAASASPNNATLPPPQTSPPGPAILGFPGNLVANGDFETGSYSPQWTLVPGGPFDQVCKSGDPIGAATCIAHGGQYAMSFGLAGGQDSLSQSIPTVPGQTYRIRFFLANDNPADQNTTTFAVLWGGTTVFSLPSPQPTFAYRQIVVDAIATTSSTQLTFVAQHDPSQWFLDDVSAVLQAPEVPIPTLPEWGIPLLALLLGGIAVAYLRRQGPRSLR